MKTLTKVLLVVAVAFTVFSLPSVAVERPEFICFPMVCG
jgi:hypothetical protein